MVPIKAIDNRMWRQYGFIKGKQASNQYKALTAPFDIFYFSLGIHSMQG